MNNLITMPFKAKSALVGGMLVLFMVCFFSNAPEAFTQTAPGGNPAPGRFLTMKKSTKAYTKNNKTFSVTPKANPKDRIDVKVGGNKTGKFEPEVKVSRWDDEVNLSLKLKHNEQNPQVIEGGNEIEWKGDEVSAKFYELDSTAELPEGGTEIEIDLPKKPDSNKIEFDLDSKGLDFFYQPQLTAAQIAQGDTQPEYVIGSYAVYASAAKKNIVGGKEYKSGKVGHIYRPRIEDSTGNWVWGDLNINERTGTLSVTIPQWFLDTAAYPIRHAAGLTFGYTSVGANTTNVVNTGGVIVVTNPRTASSGDTITSFTQYGALSAGSGTTNWAAYRLESGYPTTRLAAAVTGTAPGSAGWYSSSTVSQALTAGHVYGVAFGVGTTHGITAYFDTGSAPGRYNSGWAGSQILDTPWPGGQTDSGSKYSVYATYTAGTSTSISTGTDPSTTTIAPSASIVDGGAFSVSTSTGTDSITAMNVSLASSGTPYDGVSEVRITSNDGSTTYFAAQSNPASNTVSFSGGTPISVTTTPTQYKIRITPKTHANMAAVPGASYDLTPLVSSFTSTNGQSGSDTNANTLTIDNLSPNAATSTSGSVSHQTVTLNWTSSSSSDISESVILRWTASSPGAEVPVEGSSYSVGNTITTATVACVVSSAASTAYTKINGASGDGTCSTSALSNGTAYSYKVFQKDSRGNYNAGTTFTGSPFTPNDTTTISTGTDAASTTIAPSASIVDAGSFSLITGNGTDSVTALTVILAGSGTPYDGVSEVRITSNDGATLYFAAVSNPVSNTVNFSGGTPIPVTTSGTQFKIRITPKTHANMAAVPGASYALSPYVSTFTMSKTLAGTDTNANTLTIDNASPNASTSNSVTSGNAQVTVAWTSSSSSDISQTVVLRRTTSAVTDVPVEGTAYNLGDTIGSSTVACILTSAASTAYSKVNGTAGDGSCQTSALTNGTAYYYKIFQKDSRGNYDAGATPTGSPVTPASNGPEERPINSLIGTNVTGTVGSGGYNMGFAFTPSANGYIDKLWVRAGSSSGTVKVYKVSDQSVVASSAITATGNTTWVSIDIAAVSLTSGTQYIVSYYNTTSFTYYDYNMTSDPVSGSITVHDSRYIQSSAYPNGTTTDLTMYGIVDVSFHTGTAPPAYGTTSVTSGDWNVGTTWGGTCTTNCTAGISYPSTSESATIATGHTVTLTRAESVAGLTIQSSGVLALSTFTLTLSGASPLTNSGSITGSTGSIEYSNATATVANTTYTGLKISGSVTGATTATVTGTLNVTGTLTPSSGTITMNNGSTITNAGTLTFQNLTIASGATVTSNTSYSVAAALTVSSTGVLNPTSGTITLNNGASLSNSGTTLSFQNLTIASGATVTGNTSYIVKGTLTNSSTATFTSNSGTVTMNNGSAIVNSGTQLTFSSLTIASSATVTANTSYTVAGTLTVSSSAVLTPSSGTVTMNNSSTISNSGTLTFFNLTTASGATVTANTSFSVGGTLTNSSTATLSPTSGTITFNNGSSFANSGTLLSFFNITIASSATVTSSGSYTVKSGGTFSSGASSTYTPAAADVITGTTATISGSGTIKVTRTAATADFDSQYAFTTKTLTSLTVDYNGTGETINNYTYGGLKVSGSVTGSSTATVGGVLTVTGTLTPSAGTITLNNGASISNSGTLTFFNLTIASGATVTGNTSYSVAGTLTNSSTATFTASSGTVTFNNGSTAVNSGTQLTFFNLTIANSATVAINTTYTVAGTLTNGTSATFTSNSGTVTMNNSSAIVNSGTQLTFNNLTITTSATVTANTSYSVAGALTVSSSAVLNPSSGTVTLNNGASLSNSGTLSFQNLTINTSATATGNTSYIVKGTLTNGTSATFTSNSGTVTMNNSSAIVNSGTQLTFNGLTIASGATVTANTSYSVAGALTVSSTGVLNPTSGTVTLNNGASISNSGTTLSFQNLTINTSATATGNTSYIVKGTLTNGTSATFTSNSGTVTLNNSSAVVNSGTQLTFNNLTIADNASVTVNTSFSIAGALTSGSGATFNPTSGTITLNNGASITGAGTISFQNLTTNTSATVTANYSYTVKGILTNGSSATFTNSSNTVTMNNGSSISNTSGTLLSFYNLSIASSATVTANTDYTVTNSLIVNSLATLAPTSGTITLSADSPLSLTGTFTTTGTNTVKFTGTTVSIPARTYQNLTLGGTGTYTMPASTITVNGNLSITSGATVTKGAGNVVLSGSSAQTITDSTASKQNLGTVQVSGSGGVLMGSSLIMTTLTIDSTRTFSANGSNTLTLTGNGTVLTATGTFTPSTGTVEFASAATTGTTIPQLSAYNNLIINKASNTFTAAGAINVNNLTITSGTLVAHSVNHVTINGDFTNNGTFTHNNGSVTIIPTSGSLTSNISGSSDTAFYNLNVTTSGATVNFGAGRTYAIAGALTVTGSDKDPVSFFSTSAGQQWLVTFNGTASITHLVLKDAGCSGGSTLSGNSKIYNRGNNGSCWGILIYGSPQGSSQGGGGSSSSSSGGGGQGGGGGSAPVQATATATRDGSNGIASVTVTNVGSGYTQAPAVCFQDSTGSGATATAILSNGSISTTITITAAGSNYSAGVTVGIAAPPGTAGAGCSSSGGGGQGGGGASP